MAYVVPAPAVPTVAVEGGGEFPVRRIFCVGQNFSDHAREMGSDPDRQEPFFFTKPADAVVADGATLPYPAMTQNLHHEVELVVAIGEGGRDIAVDGALGHVWGYAVGVDLTRRDLQAEAKKAGRPWDMAKGFDRSAPVGPMVQAEPGRAMDGGAIRLSVNGQVRQSSDLSHLTWSVAEIVSRLSRYVELAPGDLVFTGTPAGVGAIGPGDEVLAEVEGLPELRVTIAR